MDTVLDEIHYVGAAEQKRWNGVGALAVSSAVQL